MWPDERVVRFVNEHFLAARVHPHKNPDDFNLMNPLAFNAAAFMDPLTGSKFWYTLGTMFDLFTIWTIILTGIGLSAAAGKKRLSFGGGLFAAATPWVIFGLLGASMAAMFS